MTGFGALPPLSQGNLVRHCTAIHDRVTAARA
jgi:hypothetical protein